MNWEVWIMKSKTSCFNKTIFKKNMTHFWPLWALYSCYLIVSLPVGLWFDMQYYLLDDSYSQLQRQVYAISGAMRAAMNPVITFAFAAVMIMAVFSYLYSAKNTNMIHSRPVDRRELFVTNIISAFAFMIIPQILTFIITVFVCIGTHITNIQYILYWFGAEATMTFFALALGAFVAMFTGQLLAFPVYYFVVNYLYVGCWYLINMVIESVCFGVSNNWNPGKSCILSPIYYLTNNLRIQSVENSEYVTVGIEFKGAYLLGIYAVAGVVFLIAAYQLYKWRKLETAGDLISMRGIKPVFRWGVAVCAGLLGGTAVADTIGNSFSSAKVHFWILAAGTLIFGAIGFFVAEMLIEKNFRVFHKKRVGEWAVLTVVLAAFLGALKLDLFRIEGKIPDVSEVKVVSLNLDYTLRYTEPDDIQKIIDLQKEILAQKEECLSAENQYYLSITYTLKDGKKLRRSYTVPVGQAAAADKDSVVAKVTALESDPDKMMQNMFGNYYKTNEYYAGSISFVDENGRTEDYRFTQEELDAVMEAVQKDVEAGNMTDYQLYSLRAGDEDNTYRDRYFNNLDISFYNPDGIIWNYSSYSVDGVDVTEAVLTGEKTAEEAEAYFPNSDSAYVEFGSKCTNIIETLKKLGILNSERKLMTYDEYDALMNPVTAVREKGIPHIS